MTAPDPFAELVAAEDPWEAHVLQAIGIVHPPQLESPA